MAELDLPRGPRELFQAVHRPLARAFGGEENIRFGGGTALAARWAHRHSVDVDLFVGDDAYRHFHWNTGGRFILNLTADHPVERVEILRQGATVTFPERSGHVSIAPALGLPHDPRSPDTPRASRMPFETTAEILSKKLLYRMAETAENHFPRPLRSRLSHKTATPTPSARHSTRSGPKSSAEFLLLSTTTAPPGAHSPHSFILPIRNWRRMLPASSASSSNANPISDHPRVPNADTLFSLLAEAALIMIDYDLVRAYYYHLPPATLTVFPATRS